MLGMGLPLSPHPGRPHLAHELPSSAGARTRGTKPGILLFFPQSTAWLWLMVEEGFEPGPWSLRLQGVFAEPLLSSHPGPHSWEEGVPPLTSFLDKCFCGVGSMGGVPWGTA